ncbi:MAG: DUF6364 family protein [Bacteroidia bacterium]
MNSKLTLKLDTEIIKLAQSVSKEKGKSVSKLLEEYFKSFKKHSSKKSIATKWAGIAGEKKLRSLNDDRLNHILNFKLKSNDKQLKINSGWVPQCNPLFKY